ncbi:hypothetical protein HHI36_008923 [Cryptolaemus montrouzieri]|uniref:Very-long-chain 3-oxoacyl-CoA synthase n=1 Tax=Cryptolaemus montrouzieri TaxID=559131 RepID=A0ABD2MTS7_9CUCU
MVCGSASRALLPHYIIYQSENLWDMEQKLDSKTPHNIQMGLTFLHSAQLLFYDCGYPRWTVFFTMPNAILFVILFYDFYKQVYFKNREAKTEIETKSDENNNTNEVMENTQEISSPKCNGLEKDFIHKKEE